MQPENHHPQPHSPADETPFPPSSPPHLPFHRHQPVPTLETGEGPAALRRRTTGLPSGDGSLRVEIRDPYSEESPRRDAVSISPEKRIGELKDEIAAGAFDAPGVSWQRDGMRLVWQGRIVRDEERVGDVVGKTRDEGQIHAFHLVARRIGQPRRPLPSRQASDVPIASSSAAHPPPADIPAAALNNDRTVQALLDCTHYLLFTARHHLCHLTGMAPLAWDDAVPKPTVPQSIAREAVVSVLRVFHDSQSESSWGAWEGAFEGDSEGDILGIWERVGREGGESEIRTLWESRIGRAWREGADGEVVQVEVDGLTRELHLPPLAKLAPAQLIHLLLYLRTTCLVPHVAHRLHLESQPPPSSFVPSPTAALVAPTPTPTRPAQPANPLADIPLPVLNHLFFSALKISAMLWMLVGNMKWSDTRLWIIYGVSFAYWAVDGYRVYQAALPRRPARPGAAAAAAPPQPGAGAGAGAVPPPPGAVAAAGLPGNAAPAVGTNPPAAGVDPIQQVRDYRARNPWTVFPLLHLDIDSLQLHVPAFSTHVEFEREVAAQIANDPERADAIRRRAGRAPAWIQTQLFLPIALWFITLIPECETLRARAIRKRERAMRVLVGEMTIALGEPVEEGQSQAPVFPEGLGKSAEKYYRRVLHRGEGIDWQEEREAQMLLGIGEEEEDRGGDGMRMGML